MLTRKKYPYGTSETFILRLVFLAASITTLGLTEALRGPMFVVLRQFLLFLSVRTPRSKQVQRTRPISLIYCVCHRPSFVSKINNALLL